MIEDSLYTQGRRLRFIQITNFYSALNQLSILHERIIKNTGTGFDDYPDSLQNLVKRWKERETKLRHLLLILMLLAPIFAPAARSNLEVFPVKTVILVRHAEKMEAPREDPPLTEAGKARAALLAKMLARAGVKAIYTSQFLRTRETAEPLAKQLGVTATPITIQSKRSNPREVSEESIKQIVDRIMNGSADTVLVVGHSNSVPDVVRMLGAEEAPAIDEKNFDDLFIVTVYDKGKARVTHLKYGN